MKSNCARLAAIAMAASLALPAAASTFDLYTVGSTNPYGAQDPAGNPLGGIPIIAWTQMLAGVPTSKMLLSILAEGIDGGPGAPNGGERDAVYVNGTLAGYLTQQSFYSIDFNLQPGPGALAGKTAETMSVFDVTSLLVSGLNGFEVRVDLSNWVDEIEVASLRPIALQVPEPSSLPLAGFALAGIALVRRRAPR